MSQPLLLPYPHHLPRSRLLFIHRHFLSLLSRPRLQRWLSLLLSVLLRRCDQNVKGYSSLWNRVLGHGTLQTISELSGCGIALVCHARAPPAVDYRKV